METHDEQYFLGLIAEIKKKREAMRIARGMRGYVWVPYIMAETTTIINEATFQKNMMSSRYKIVNSKNYLTIKII